uniref:Ig-like domain-containing protein n=1 Tax=Oncorhynchus mykiss TaxID=8022 RepID=A0A8C7NKC3_ONCMY
MPKLTFIGLYFWICLAQKLVSGDLYHEVGGKLVLTPDKSTVTDPITSILWKHGKNKVAEWDKDFGGLDIYAAFKERTTLDQTTGELKISGLMKTDSGVYSVEFNSKLLDKTYTLSVIKAVPKPKITSSCNANQTSCTLTCEGDTTDAEPVTYRWKVAEGAWEVGVKQFNVFKSDTGQSNNGYKYICKLNNAVIGEGKVSEPVGEVFGPEPSNTSTIVVGVVILALAAVVTGLLVWKKKTRYPHNTWIDFLRKFFCARFVAESKTDGSAAPVGEDESKTNGCTAPVDEDESKTDGCTAPVGEDESKPDGCAAPVGEDKSKTDGSAAPVGEDESKTDGSAAPVGEDESKTDGCAAPVGEDESKTGGCAAPVGEDESKTDGCAAPVGEDESKTDGCAAPVGEDESKTGGCAAPVGEDESKTDGCAAPVGEDESKTDDCAAPVGEDESKMDGSTAPGADLNAAEGEAKGGKDDSYCRTTGNCGPEVRRGS